MIIINVIPFGALHITYKPKKAHKCDTHFLRSILQSIDRFVSHIIACSHSNYEYKFRILQ